MIIVCNILDFWVSGFLICWFWMFILRIRCWSLDFWIWICRSWIFCCLNFGFWILGFRPSLKDWTLELFISLQQKKDSTKEHQRGVVPLSNGMCGIRLDKPSRCSHFWLSAWSIWDPEYPWEQWQTAPRQNLHTVTLVWLVFLVGGHRKSFLVGLLQTPELDFLFHLGTGFLFLQSNGEEKCGSPLSEPCWDGTLKLWRSKCEKITTHPVSGKERRSPHEAFKYLDRTCVLHKSKTTGFR